MNRATFTLRRDGAGPETKLRSDRLIVTLSLAGEIGFGEGTPRSVSGGETLAEAESWLLGLQPQVAGITSLYQLEAFVQERREDIDAHPMAWCALEMAFLDALARASRLSVERFTGLASVRGDYRFTTSLGDEEDESLETLVRTSFERGVEDFRFRLSGDASADLRRLRRVHALAAPRGLRPRVRVDAGALWREGGEEALRRLLPLRDYFWAIKEPGDARPARELSRLSVELDRVLVLDESLARLADFDAFEGSDGSYAVHLRVAKMGGLLRSLEVLERVRDLSWPLVIGSRLGEGPLLARAGFAVAAQARDLLVVKESSAEGLRHRRGPRLSFEADAWARLEHMGPGWGLEPGELSTGSIEARVEP